MKNGSKRATMTKPATREKDVDMEPMDGPVTAFRRIVKESGLARDAVVTSHGTGIGTDTGKPLRWYIIRKTNRDVPRVKFQRASHTFWALIQCMETGVFQDAMAVDKNQARARLSAMVRGLGWIAD